MGLPPLKPKKKPMRIVRVRDYADDQINRLSLAQHAFDGMDKDELGRALRWLKSKYSAEWPSDTFFIEDEEFMFPEEIENQIRAEKHMRLQGWYRVDGEWIKRDDEGTRIAKQGDAAWLRDIAPFL